MTLPVDPSRYLAYLGVMTAMCFFPGPANLACVAMGLSRGPRAVLATVAGMNSASLIWYIGAALGLTALEVTFPALFKALQFGGAAYLAWLAFTSVRDAFKGSHRETASAGPVRGSAYWRGFAVQFANPKVLLFFTAFLPGFIDPARSLATQFLVIASTFAAIELVTEMLIAGMAQRINAWLARIGRRFNRICGGIIAIIGVMLPMKA